MSIQGHRIRFDYRGIRKVCSRCGAEGDLGNTCETPRCERCEVCGHESAKCTSPCHRCAGNHVTADCFLPRAYASAAADTNIPDSVEDNDGQPDQNKLPKDFLNDDRVTEVQPSLEEPRNSELSETSSHSESSDEDIALGRLKQDVLQSTQRTRQQIPQCAKASPPTSSPTSRVFRLDEGTAPSLSRHRHLVGWTGFAQGNGYHVPRTTDPSLKNPVSQVIDLLPRVEAMDTDKPEIKRTRENDTDSSGSQKDDQSELVMDEEEAEQAATPAKSGTEQGADKEARVSGLQTLAMTVSSVGEHQETATTNAVGVGPVLQDEGPTGESSDATSVSQTQQAASIKPAVDESALGNMDAETTPAKRRHDDVSAVSQEPRQRAILYLRRSQGLSFNFLIWWPAGPVRLTTAGYSTTVGPEYNMKEGLCLASY
ncbi:hypothetical protein HPB49_013187 [Dermacentor silvarum]|uniref:Uncharacterized protein n=1 Tax=Dermacentor silvarum TaxID=543639 RepID=A0ACB8DD51_DERSI|nr:hypothetical protein HPB49_013187 [Dermacentor silvarum]